MHWKSIKVGLSGGTMLLALIVVGAVAAPSSPPGSQADGSNPYANITNRNVFGLRSPPPPPVPKPDTASLPVVTLSGIVRDGDELDAMFSVKTKSGNKEDVSYLTLSKAAPQLGPIELVSINEAAGAVDIINSGTPETLTMKDNGYKGGGPAPGAGGAPAFRGAVNPGLRNGGVPPPAPVSATSLESAAGAAYIPTQPGGGGGSGTLVGGAIEPTSYGTGFRSANTGSTGSTIVGSGISFSSSSTPNETATGAVQLPVIPLRALNTQDSIQPNWPPSTPNSTLPPPRIAGQTPTPPMPPGLQQLQQSQQGQQGQQ